MSSGLISEKSNEQIKRKVQKYWFGSTITTEEGSKDLVVLEPKQYYLSVNSSLLNFLEFLNNLLQIPLPFYKKNCIQKKIFNTTMQCLSNVMKATAKPLENIKKLATKGVL